MVNEINDYVMSKMPGDSVEYLSSDSISKTESVDSEMAELFSVEFLNTINCSRLPNHRILLKVGCMIMLLRNIDQASELCNGTRLIVTNMGKHIIEARMISGMNVGQKVFIPRMTMSPSDETKFPLSFDRRQFPISVYFEMTKKSGTVSPSLMSVSTYLLMYSATDNCMFLSLELQVERD